jgi:predicted Zn-dependent protease
MNEEMLEKIEAYLANEMDVEERKAFELLLQEDSQLAEEVKLHQDAELILKVSTQISYKEKLQEIDKELKAASAPKIRSMRTGVQRWLIAASVIVAVGVTFWMFSRQQTHAFEQAFQPYNNVLALRGDTISDLSTAMLAYDREQYDLAIEYMDTYLEGKPGDVFAQFYKGISLLAMDKNQEAAQLLQSLPESIPMDEARDWYLALALGKAGDEAAAKAILDSIRNTDGHAYKEKAQKIWEKL